MSGEQVIHIQVDQSASRIDRFLVQEVPTLSRSQAQKLIRQGQVLLSNPNLNKPPETVQPSSRVQSGDVVTLHLPLPLAQPKALQPETVPLDVVFEDEALVVVNKPAGLVVHPAHGHTAGTLVNALVARYPELLALTQADADSADRPGIVHRLDRDTSGLIIVARTPAALLELRRQFKARKVDKVYLALVFGRPDLSEGIIEVPLGRHPRHRQKFAPRADGKPARTRYSLLEDYGQYSLLEIGLETGRTHQIRVHLAWLGCPVVGDRVYGRKKNPLGLKRQFLHACRLRFRHPSTGNLLDLEAPLGSQLQAVLQRLK